MELQKLELETGNDAMLPAQDDSPVSNPPKEADTPAPSIPVGVTTKKKKFPLALKIIFIALTVILVFSAVVGVLAYQLIAPLKATSSSASAAVASLQSQDLVKAEEQLKETKANLETVQNRYRTLIFTKYIPLLGLYYSDGEHTIQAGLNAIDAGQDLIKAIEPYSDLLGFKAKEGAQAVAESAEDRIVFLVQTLDAIAPQLDNISKKLNAANDEIQQINPDRYPTSIAGKAVRARIIETQDSIKSAGAVLSQAQPLIKLLPKLLGQDKESEYMLLFQNDAEQRPTGGFLTAYAYLKVFKGKFTPQDSFDIYDLDNRFTKNVPAPAPIKKYLEENTWHLRNMNFSPDFRVSMDTFTQNYYSIPGVKKIDGIISVDTQVPVMLLKILGPIGVGGWGNFTAEIDKRCDCPQVIYALEEIADRPVGTTKTARKAVLGPLMHSLLANAMGSPKSKWPTILNAMLDAIKEKHLMFYFADEQSQAAAEAFNAAGRVKAFDGDYLQVNGANFGGAKSNMFTSEEVQQDYEIGGDRITKTVTITYNNPFPGSNCNLEAGQLCLNGVLRQYIRLYVPKGSKLISVVGSESTGTESEDLDKTVLDAYFTLRPQSSSKLVFTYTLPEDLKSPLKLLIQKQPGKPSQKYTINFNGRTQTIDLNSDTELTLQ